MPEVIERLEEQSGLLLRTYEAEFAKDPTSHATESSRSNLIALRHTISQIYGESTALDVPTQKSSAALFWNLTSRCTSEIYRSCSRLRSHVPLASSQFSSARTLARASAIEQSAAP